ncbi:uncharacterized protein RAG0_15812 [Rhynchosporium agropyri]|uniref:Uncharacterized protein n=1 Tax=Rhynchosporium agropyri TaxID=914238 RepID=A0A1E1LPG1_9HELO|nr:uncharacterized protein RAG0_15812 [Rhynchosporium agropyri]
MPGKSNTKDGRPVDPRPLPSTLDPSETGGEIPTPSTKKRNVPAIVKSTSAKVTPNKIAKPASMTTPFRHKWMKKFNSKGVPFADAGMTSGSPANTSEDDQKTPNSAKGKSKAVGYSPSSSFNGSPGPSTFGDMGPPITPRKDEDDDECDWEAQDIDSDGDQEVAFMDNEGKIGQYTKVPSALNNIDKARRKIKAEEGVIDPNGRQIGRQLVLWHRPRMIEKLILHVQYECHKAGVQIPWDHVVHRLQPGSSGPSALQMMNKLRDVLVTEGHMIPPVLGKRTAPVDPTLRGYKRDLTSDIPTTTKAVRWTDECPDLKESLVVPGLIRGSGKYRKVAKIDRVHVPEDKDTMSAGQRRNRKPASVNKWAADQRALKGSARKIKIEEGTGTGSSRKRRNNELEEDSDSEIDPAELDSDGDFVPGRKKSGSRQKRANTAWSSPNNLASPTPKSRKRSSKGAVESDVEYDEEENENSLIVQLAVPSEGLVKFDPGFSGKKPKHVKYFHPPKRLFQEKFVESRYQAETMDGGDLDVDTSYQGPELHGPLELYMRAMENGTDPNLNRLGFETAEAIYEKCKDNPAARARLNSEEAEAMRAFEELVRASQVPANSIEVDQHDQYAVIGSQVSNNEVDGLFGLHDQQYAFNSIHGPYSPEGSYTQGSYFQGSYAQVSNAQDFGSQGSSAQVSYAQVPNQHEQHQYQLQNNFIHQRQTLAEQASRFENQAGFKKVGNGAQDFPTLAGGSNILEYSHADQSHGYAMNTAQSIAPASFDDYESPIIQPRQLPLRTNSPEPINRSQPERRPSSQALYGGIIYPDYDEEYGFESLDHEYLLRDPNVVRKNGNGDREEADSFTN